MGVNSSTTKKKKRNMLPILFLVIMLAPSQSQQQEDTARSAFISWLYWPSSPEVYYQFRPKGYDDRLSSASAVAETPQEALEHRIHILRSVHDNEHCWRNVVVDRETTFVPRPKLRRCNRDQDFCNAPFNWL